MPKGPRVETAADWGCPPVAPDYDLVAEMDGRLVRVEVKTTCSRTPFNHWQARLCTRGGNQSWSGTTKHFDPRRCDFVFVHAGDGRRWFIPTVAIEATSAIVLGGPKYSEFEVERGVPLPAQTAPTAASTIALP